MARYGRGLICLTLTRDRCRQLRLPLMVSDTDVDQRTNFTVSIEAAEGVTTGISAAAVEIKHMLYYISGIEVFYLQSFNYER